MLWATSQQQQQQQQPPSPSHQSANVAVGDVRLQHNNSTSSTTTRSSSRSSTSSSAIRTSEDKGSLPQHVAFICDGNSRWAHSKGLETSQGHVQGADRLVQLLQQLQHDRISYCTLYGFSTENWKRPPHEIQNIFQVMEATAHAMFPRIVASSSSSSSLLSTASSMSSIRIKILGDLDDERIPYGLRRILQELQRITANQPSLQELTQRDHNDNDPSTAPHFLTVCLAINYGGQQDILQATKKVAAAVLAGELSLQDLDRREEYNNEEEDGSNAHGIFASYLSTAGIPDPDLIVRTSGEHRLSNFLLWNSAYSEFYVTDTLWPDFDIDSWHDALRWYQQRNRRFGSRESTPTAASPRSST